MCPMFGQFLASLSLLAAQRHEESDESSNDEKESQDQQNFPEKVTGCNSWGKKVLPFGALPLELPVDL